jgi:hypothetical protein
MGKGGSTPQTTAAPAPPPTASTLEIQQAKIDAARQAKAKRGINASILQGQQPLGAAGGNPLEGQQSVPKSSVLGGG